MVANTRLIFKGGLSVRGIKSDFRVENLLVASSESSEISDTFVP